MRLFTLALMMFLTVFGVSVGFKAITGKDLLTLKWPIQSNTEALGNTQALAAPTMVPRPTVTPTAVPPTPTPEVAEAFKAWWVQNHKETDLWPGPDSNATSLRKAPQWSYFQVLEPQNGPRLHVLDPTTNREGYIDALAVGPSAAPPTTSATSPADSTSQAVMMVGNTGGIGVYVRRTPNMADKQKAYPDRTKMEVLQRGVEANGQRWTKVRTPDGTEGYVPEAYLVPAG